MKNNIVKFISYHQTPIFRNNYNIVLGVSFKNSQGIKFSYCDNNKKWLAFKSGEEIGILNDVGIAFAKSCCNPDSPYVIEKTGL